MTRSVKLYVVADVDDPPKSVVVITPVVEFSEQFACEALVNTLVVSEKANVPSPVAATVATVPENPPAIVPREPAPVVQVGASDTVNIAPDLTALPSLFSTRIKYVPSTGKVKLAVIDVALVNVIVFAAVTAPVEEIASTCGTDTKFVPAMTTFVAVLSNVLGVTPVIVGLFLQ